MTITNGNVRYRDIIMCFDLPLLRYVQIWRLQKQNIARTLRYFVHKEHPRSRSCRDSVVPCATTATAYPYVKAHSDQVIKSLLF